MKRAQDSRRFAVKSENAKEVAKLPWGRWERQKLALKRRKGSNISGGYPRYKGGEVMSWFLRLSISRSLGEARERACATSTPAQAAFDGPRWNSSREVSYSIPTFGDRGGGKPSRIWSNVHAKLHAKPDFHILKLVTRAIEGKEEGYIFQGGYVPGRQRER